MLAAAQALPPEWGAVWEQATLISDVKVIYRLYFLGKVQRFISRRQAVCKHMAHRCDSVGGRALRAPVSRREVGHQGMGGQGRAGAQRTWCPLPAGHRHYSPLPLTPQGSGSHTYSLRLVPPAWMKREGMKQEAFYQGDRNLSIWIPIIM